MDPDIGFLERDLLEWIDSDQAIGLVSSSLWMISSMAILSLPIIGVEKIHSLPENCTDHLSLALWGKVR